MCSHKVDGVIGLAVVARVQVTAARHACCEATLHAYGAPGKQHQDNGKVGREGGQGRI